MMIPEVRARAAPVRSDFHCAFLWVRAMELEIGGATPQQWLTFHGELLDLFARYRSPWRA